MAKKGNHAKIQHYVSQFQLRNFADERGQLRVFDKAEGRIFTLSPHGIAAEAGFYDFTDQAGKPHTVEHLLGKMETQVSGIIAGILDRQSLAHLTAKDRGRHCHARSVCREECSWPARSAWVLPC
jgi:hypothetical protein